MSKTLYISDLDGTLLNSSCEISEETAQIINGLISEKGISFSVATARTSETVPTLTKKLNINTPCIVMNGVALYDIKSKAFVSYEKLDKTALAQLSEVIKSFGSWGFLYAISNNRIETFYVNCDTPNSYNFMQERINKYQKKFTQVCDFSSCINEECVYYSVSHKEEFLKPIYDRIKEIKGLSIEYYRDVYNPDFWYLEVCSDKASKKLALLKLKKLMDFDSVVAFGDNLNDLPLFEEADQCFSVSNAKDEVKKKATAVIDSNDNDGVAKWLLKSLTI